MGKGVAFETAIADFSVAYADQNERDYQSLAALGVPIMLFSKALGSVFESDDLAQYVFKFIRDAVVLAYFLSAGATMISRTLENRKARVNGV